MKTMKFHFWDDKPPILYRPGTSDEAIIQSILIDRQEYLFPAGGFQKIFDIGANIGVVSVLLANLYPDAKIHAFEPVKENFDLLLQNTFHYPQIRCHAYGLGKETGMKRIYESAVKENLGGFSTEIIHGKGQEIEIESVQEFCETVGTPDLIKIDCEGAEYEILTHLPDIHNVKWISGELHGIRDYRLLDFLSGSFYLQFSKAFHQKNWHFQAIAKTWTSSGLDQLLPD